MIRKSITSACFLGILLVAGMPHLQADDGDPFLESGRATAATAPTTRPAPAWLPGDLEQRRKAVKARHEQDLASLRKVLLDAYQASGDTSPKWDENARKAICAFAVGKVPELSDRSDVTTTLNSSFYADNSGCHDGLVQYALARMMYTVSQPTSADHARQIEAGRHMLESEYPDTYKLYGLLRTIQFIANDEFKIPNEASKKKIDDGHLEILGLADSIAKAPPIQRYELINLFEVAGEASYEIYHDRMRIPSEMLAGFGEGYADRSSLLTAEGCLWINYAWDARGSGWGNTVSDDNSGLFENRLARAQTVLTKAWNLDHDNAWAAKFMITVCRGRGLSRAIMEKWFKAAVAADPDAFAAYAEKLEYLEPKWCGSPDDMLSFGRECMAFLPDDSERRLTLVAVHLRLSQYDVPDYAYLPQRSYFAKSPKIWTDIEAAYEPYIKACGLSDFHRLRYARLALWCKQPDKARELLRPYGNYDGQFELTIEEVDAMRQELGLAKKK